VVDVGGQRKPTTAKNEQRMLNFGGRGVVVGGSQRKHTTAENRHACLISGVMGGHGGSSRGQRKPTTTEN